MDVVELVKSMEDKFGVSAAAAVVAAPVAAAGEAAAAEEKTEFNVVLTKFGANKIDVIKVYSCNYRSWLERSKRYG